LENKLARLEDRMDEVRNLTAMAAAKSSIVSQEALDLLILDLTLPPVDIDRLRQQIEGVSNEVT
jgi:DNA-binding response OmpR family regulator